MRKDFSHWSTDQLETRIGLLESWATRDRAEGRLPLAIGELEDLFEELTSRLGQSPEAPHPETNGSMSSRRARGWSGIQPAGTWGRAHINDQ
jgi:hypothetical protein